MLNCPRCRSFDPERHYCRVMLTSVPGICPYADERPRTHYDEIVRKSPEELAKWRANGQCPPGSFYGDYNCVSRDCADCWLDWLRQEVQIERNPK